MVERERESVMKNGTVGSLVLVLNQKIGLFFVMNHKERTSRITSLLALYEFIYLHGTNSVRIPA